MKGASIPPRRPMKDDRPDAWVIIIWFNLQIQNPISIGSLTFTDKVHGPISWRICKGYLYFSCSYCFSSEHSSHDHSDFLPLIGNFTSAMCWPGTRLKLTLAAAVFDRRWKHILRQLLKKVWLIIIVIFQPALVLHASNGVAVCHHLLCSELGAASCSSVSLRWLGSWSGCRAKTSQQTLQSLWQGFRCTLCPYPLPRRQ